VEQARNVTEQLNLPYHPVLFDDKTLVDELDYDLAQLEYMVWLMETPRFNIEWVFKHELHRYAKTVIPGLKVMLVGQGADMFAGGSSTSLGQDRQSWDEYLAGLRGTGLKARREARGIPSHFHPLLADSYPSEAAADGCSDYIAEMLRRTFSTQRYSLWHEDRTSSAQSIQSRLPFLDHRLLEMPASIPPRYHETLLFDKRIVRENLGRFLPKYPTKKPKVRFYRTGKEVSVARLLVRMLGRVFPEFSAKYLERQRAMFSRDKLTELYQRIISGGRFRMQILEFLFECMAIAIFEDMCRNLARRDPPKGFGLPSPLREVKAVG
jgi:asparagine synthase (glutamine-hydrolysing)